MGAWKLQTRLQRTTQENNSVCASRVLQLLSTHSVAVLSFSKTDQQKPITELARYADYILRIQVFWNVKLCHWVSGSWHLNGIWYLHVRESRGPRRIAVHLGLLHHWKVIGSQLLTQVFEAVPTTFNPLKDPLNSLYDGIIRLLKVNVNTTHLYGKRSMC